MNRQPRRRSVLRAGFEDDFTIIFAERITQVSNLNEQTEKIEWIDEADTKPRRFRVSTMVVTGIISLGVNIFFR